jgi:hypothetical protein
MKILILSLPRVGSTSFATSLSNTLNIPLVNIPDSYTYKENGHLITKMLSKENIILRVSPSEETGYELLDFIDKFNYIVFLSRRDNDEHYKSFVNLYYKLYIKQSGYHDKYNVTEIPQKYYNQLIDEFGWKAILENKKKLEKVSNITNIPILYYEDLYYNQTGFSVLKHNLPILNINEFKKHLNVTKKLQVDVIKTLL